MSAAALATTTVSDAPSLVVGIVQVVLAIVVLRHLGRFGKTFPWLGGLMVYFGVRGGARLYTAVSGHEPYALALASDALLAVILVIATATLDSTMRALRLAIDRASDRAQEYRRALDDYRRLARHRIANPLAIVSGGIQTLRAHPDDLTNENVHLLLNAMEEAVDRLERISLAPTELTPEERQLNPSPSGLIERTRRRIARERRRSPWPNARR